MNSHQRQPGDWFARLVLASVFLIPIQIPLGGLFRIAPSDLLICAAIPLGIRRVSIAPRSGLLGPFLFPIVMLWGLVLSALVSNRVLSHAVFVKTAGAAVLLVSLLFWQQVARESDEGFTRLIRAFLIGSFVFTVAGLVEWVIGTSHVSERFIESRFAGAYYDPNHYGSLTVVALLLLSATHRKIFAKRWVSPVIAGVLLLGLLLSASRGAWIGLVLGAGLVVWYRPPPRLPAKVVAAGAGALLVLLLSGFVGRVLEDISDRPDNVDHRTSLMEEGIERLEASRFVGIGLSVFLDDNEIIIHNSAVWLVVEMGLVGLVVYLLFVGEPTVRLLECRRRSRTREVAELAAALLAAHLAMAFSSLTVEATYQRQWWFVLALTIALSSRLNAVETESPPDQDADASPIQPAP